MADPVIRVTVGADTQLSYGQIKSDLESVVQRINASPIKIKFQLDPAALKVSDLTKQINSALSGQKIAIDLGGGKSVTGVIGDIKKVTTAAKEAAAQMKLISSDTNLWSKARGSVDKLNADIIQMQTKMRGLKTVSESTKTSMNSLISSFDKFNKAVFTGLIDEKTYTEQLGALKAKAAELLCSLKLDASNDKAAQQMANDAQKIANNFQNIGDATGAVYDKFHSFQRHLSTFTSIYASIRQIVQVCRQLVSVISEVDSQMAQLEIVTGASEARLSQYSKTISNVANETAGSIADLVESTTTYARLGYSLDESTQLARLTAMLQNVGDIDVGSAQSAITAIVKAYDVGASDLESVMDKLVEVGNGFPISVSELAEGMNNAGSMLASAGNSLEESLALLTAANATVQNVSKSSTGLRTIAARLRKMKTELDDLGEAYTEADYDAIIQALTRHNVSLTDSNGELRGTFEVLQDIAHIWDRLNTTEQAGLVEKIAGTRQQNIFYSLIGNFQEAEGAMESMADAQGTLTEKNEIYTDSLEAHIQRVKNAWTAFLDTTENKSLINGALDFAVGFLKALQQIGDFIEKIGGLKSILLTLAPLLWQTFGTKIINGITSMADKIGGTLNGAFTNVIASLRAFKTSQDAANASMQTGQKAAIGLGNAISTALGVFGLITMVATAIKSFIDALTGADQIEDIATQHENTLSRINNINDAYQEYQDTLADQSSTVAEVNSAREALIAALGVERSEVAELVKEYGDLDEAYQHLTYNERIEAAKELFNESDLSTKSITNKARFFDQDSFLGLLPNLGDSAAMASLTNGVAIFRQWTETAEEADDLINRLQESGIKAAKTWDNQIEFDFNVDPSSADSMIEYYNKVTQAIEFFEKNGLDERYGIYDVLVEQREKYKEDVDNWKTYAKEGLSEVISANKDLLESHSGIKDILSDITDEYDDTTEATTKAQGAFKQYRSALLNAVMSNDDIRDSSALTVEDIIAEVDAVLKCDEAYAQLYGTIAEPPKSSFTDALQGIEDAAQAAKDAVIELDDALKADDYDAGYDKRIEAFEKMKELADEGAAGSLHFGAYADYFMGEDMTDFDSRLQWIQDNAKYFEDADEGLNNWLNTIHELENTSFAKGGLKGIASYDTETDTLWYDPTKLEEFAEAFGWTSEAIEDFVGKYRMYVDEWHSIDAIEAAPLLEADGAIKKFGDSVMINKGQIEDWCKAYDMSDEDIQRLITDLHGLDGYEDGIDLDFRVNNGDVSTAVESINTLVAEMGSAGASIEEQGAAIADALSGLDGEYVLKILTEIDPPADLAAEINENLPADEDLRKTVAFDAETGQFYDAKNDVEGELSNLDNDSAAPTVALNGAGTVIGQIHSIAADLSNLNGASATVTTYVNKVEQKATGSPGVTGGMTLLGDERSLSGKPKPELVVHNGEASLAGLNGPEIRDLSPGDIVYNYEQTKRLLGSSQLFSGKIPALAGGTSRRTTVNANNTNAAVNVNLGSDGGSSSSDSSDGGSSSSDSSKEDTKKTIDWIETKIKRIERLVKKLQTTANNTFVRLSRRLRANRKEISKVTAEIKIQRQAYQRYMKEANSVNLSSNLKEAVRNGKININDYSDEIAEQISLYQQWYEKALDAKDAVQELSQTISELRLDRFEMIQSHYEDIIGRRDSRKQSVSDYSTSSHKEAAQIYKHNRSLDTKNLASLNKELKKLQKAEAAAMSDPNNPLKKGSEEWYKMEAAIQDVRNSIKETKESIAEAFLDNFKDIQTRYDNLINRRDYLNKQSANDYSTSSHAEAAKVFANNREADRKNIKSLNNELKKLQKAEAAAMSDPNNPIKKGSAAWYEMEQAIQDVKDNINDLNASIAQSYMDNFSDIQTRYDQELQLMSHLTNTYEAGISTLQAKGYLNSTKYYEALSKVESDNIKLYKSELEGLEAELSAAMSDPDSPIKQGSADWYEMQDAINGVKEKIDEANLKTIEYANSIRELGWEIFEFGEQQISQLTQEADFLINLMKDGKLYNDNGQFNQQGMATLGLRGQNYDVYMAQADDYAREIEKINKELADDPNNTTLIKKKQEYVKLQQESILSANQEKQAIVSLVEEGIKIELDNLRELIDTYKDSLSAAKDLYTYQKNIEKQTKNIASLQKQLSAYQNDTSEETKATVQRLKVSLEDAESELADTQYDKFVSDTEKLLDNLYDDYENVLNRRLDDVTTLMKDMIATINDNASKIYETLSQESNDVGATMSSELKEIWKDGISESNVVTLYDSNTGISGTTTNDVIEEVKQIVEDMTTDSDVEAEKKIEATTPYTNTTTTTPKKSSTTTTAINKKSNTTTTKRKSTTTTTPKKSNTTTTKKKSTTTTTTTKKVALTNSIKRHVAAAIWNGNYGWGTGTDRVNKLNEVFGKNNGIQNVVNKGAAHVAGVDPSGYSYKAMRKKFKGYRTGGLGDYTGLAMIHGTPDKPEIILNSKDSANFMALKDTLSELATSHNIADMSGVFNGLYNANGSGGINVGDTTLNIMIDHVDDYNDLVNKMTKDKQYEKFIRSITIDRIVGGSAVAKNKFKW